MGERVTLCEIKAVLADCAFNDWKFHVGLDGDRPFLQVRATTVDNHGDGQMSWGGRKWFLSPHMTRSEIVQTAFLATMTAVEHETREQFTYRGLSIFDPHYDVDMLFSLRALDGYADKRKAAA